MREEYDMETQCWICPHCHDDHSQDYVCGEKKLADECVRLQGTIDDLQCAMALTIARADDYADSYISQPVRQAYTELKQSRKDSANDK